MTNAEAIEILKHLRDDLHLQSKEYIDCFGMAISALEKQEQKKPMTNADKIRVMTDKELAKMFLSCDDHVYRPCPSDIIAEYRQIKPASECYDCTGCWLDWLKQEMTDNG